MPVWHHWIFSIYKNDQNFQHQIMPKYGPPDLYND